VTAKPANTSATVNWVPVNDGLTISGYSVAVTPGGQTCTTTYQLSCRFNGLTNGTAYTFAVTATDKYGTGPAGTATTTPATVPGPPLSVAGTSENSSVLVGWSAPTSNGGAPVTQYKVTASPGGETCTFATTSCTVTGLTNGSGYTFTVTASNSAGTGPGGFVTLFAPGCAPAAYGELAGCNFTDINLSGADLSQSDLTGATFADAVLTGADLDNADFTDVVLDGADLTGAALNLDGASYGGVSAVGTALPTGYVVVGGYLLGYGADLSGGDFTGAVLNYTSLTDDNFTGADFAGVDVDHTDFTGSDFTGADLDGANFSSTTLSGVTWDNTTCPDGTNSDADSGTCVNDLG
jgi:uncharacterized protein YjbI with pentapeptide repeats